MSNPPLKIMLIGRAQESCVPDAQELAEFLADQSGILFVGTCSIDGDEDVDHVEPDADLLVVAGGDGTLLRTCRWLGSRQRPILGVNLGRLGFLTDLSPDQFRDQFDCIRRREFSLTRHLMFECVHRRDDGTTDSFHGLNEVAISSAGSLRMIDVRLSIDDEEVTTFSGDGVIISTPVGSTAHSLSAGGPILRQDLQAFVITPLCPHALTNRPIVDSADRVFRFSVANAVEGVTMVIDGQIKRPVAGTDSIEVRRAPFELTLARLPGNSYYHTLHRKLGWGGQLQARAPR